MTAGPQLCRQRRGKASGAEEVFEVLPRSSPESEPWLEIRITSSRRKREVTVSRCSSKSWGTVSLEKGSCVSPCKDYLDASHWWLLNKKTNWVLPLIPYLLTSAFWKCLDIWIEGFWKTETWFQIWSNWWCSTETWGRPGGVLAGILTQNEFVLTSCEFVVIERYYLGIVKHGQRRTTKPLHYTRPPARYWLCQTSGSI